MFIELLILFFSSLLFNKNFIEGMMTKKDEKKMTKDAYNRAKNFSNIEINNAKMARSAIEKSRKLLEQINEIKSKQEIITTAPEDEREVESRRMLEMAMQNLPG